MKSAPNLILVGPMGSGKTTIGRKLADRLGLHFVDADQEIERLTGAPIPLIFEHEGESGFRIREHATLKQLCAESGQVIATGGGAVVHPDTRRLLPEHGFVLHLDITLDAQLQRLANDRSRPLLQQGDKREILQRISTQRAPFYRAVADLCCDTSGPNLHHTIETILRQLNTHWRCTLPTLDASP